MLFARLGLAATIIGFQSLTTVGVAQGAEEDIVIEEATITLSPPGAPFMAGYLVIRNTSDESVAIEKVDSEAFGSISIHLTSVNNGVASMRPAPMPFQIPGRSELQMKPGGVHLMIADGPVELEPGDSASLAVRLADGRVVRTEAELMAIGERPANHHHHGASRK